ncbi:MAG: D-tyrosyl-tRNA(Tyr) deacylase [Candidatus Woesearchaeota archaeon]|nr:MAG: D-tyrosyl-tRNA(Tyr) deacylase [Candidatus Woesearchaeota archaeon]
MKIIVVSKVNIASRNIGKIILENYDFKETSDKWEGSPIYKYKDIKLIKCNKDVLELDYLEDFDTEILVIASTHKAESGIHSLTCHTPGNWSKAEYGGKDKVVSVSHALCLRETLLELKKQQEAKKLDFEVSLEVTHHGPSLDIPTMFVEVGSSEEQWNNMKACEAVAETIMKVLTRDPEKVTVAVGFGGGHYANKFTKLLFKKEIAVGHICPKYATDALDEEMILQAFSKTVPKPDLAVIDWKGLKSEQRKNIIDTLEKNNIKWEKA